MTTAFTLVGSPGSIGPTSGGKVYAYNNIGTTAQTVAPASAFRTGITFDNPGANDVVVAPAVVQALNVAPATPPGSSVALVLTTTNLGGGYRISANGGSRTIVGECQGAWQAIALTGATNTLTVTDSNI
jgi:hypothetical protein